MILIRKHMKRPLLTFLVTVACCLGTARAVTVDDFAARALTNAQGLLLYRLFVPTNYNPATKYPLVIFLHGAGERGSDNRLQLTGQTGVLVFASAANQSKYPSFMIAPQCPTGGAWADSIRRQQVFDLINALEVEFSIDPDRLYLTGLSMGGYGTWDYITAYTNMYAAAVPMSAGGDSGLASRIIRLPIWNFHAADDGTVNVSGSRTTINALRNAGGNPIYTEYASGGHVVWTPAYNTPILMDWVYAQRRGVASTNIPILTILSPTNAPSYATTNSSLNFSGTAFDGNGTVAAVTWTNYQGTTVGGTAIGTANWTIANLPVDNTLSKLVVLTAKGTSWSGSLGGNTTFNDTLTITFKTCILSQPQSQTVMLGQNAIFTVVATSTNTLGYQWRYQGTNIPGATASNFTINNARTNDAGPYSVMVNASEGDSLSLTANLYVLSQAQSVLAPGGIVNWWPAEANANDIFGNAHGTPQSLSYSPGKVAQAFAFNGSSSYITVTPSAIAPPWTACFWVNRQNALGTSAILIGDSTQRLKLEQYNGTRSVGITRASVGDYSFNYIVPAGTWTHLAFVGTSTNTTLYVNGVFKSSLAVSVSLPRNYIGSSSSSGRFVDYLNGSLDEILLFNRALAASEINSIYAAGTAGLVRVAEFSGVTLGSDGQLTLDLKGQTGKTFSIYSSSDLINWAFVTTMANPNGTIQIPDSTTNSVQRFYRSSQP